MTVARDRLDACTTIGRSRWRQCGLADWHAARRVTFARSRGDTEYAATCRQATTCYSIFTVHPTSKTGRARCGGLSDGIKFAARTMVILVAG